MLLARSRASTRDRHGLTSGRSLLIGQSHARQTDFPAMPDAQHLQQDIPVFPPRVADLSASEAVTSQA